MQSRRIGIALGVLAGVLAVVAVSAIALGAYFYSLSAALAGATVDSISAASKKTTLVYAADGSVLAEWHGVEDRKIVPLSRMNPHLPLAVVSIEDKRFYEHHGVDVHGITRALSRNAQAGELKEGGSTITQQLAKLLFTNGERTLSRKIREAVLANQLEVQVSKDEVLGLYLNTVYFGNGAYGVESAAERYFGKTADALSVSESALLAGVIRSPSRYDPVREPEAAKQRRDLVLREMLDQGHLTHAEWSAALAEPVSITPPQDVSSLAPHFVDYVRQELIEQLGAERVYGGGLSVYTSLEPDIQKAAVKSAAELGAASDPEVALVSIRHSTGEIVAMVGGRDFGKNQFNLAAQGKRQAGSAFKPFVLVAALEKGISPKTIYSAAPYTVKVKDGVWNVQNYENKRTAGRMTLQAATNWSVNAVFARLIMQVGPKKVVDVAERLGIESPLEPDPAIALGGLKHGVSPLEMASAFGTIANGGVRTTPACVTRVTDTRGVVVFQPPQESKRAISRDVAARASRLLHGVVEDGTGQAARIGPWAAGKTGTTQSYRDAWFVGWSRELSTAVWVGYPEAQVAMDNVHGRPVTGGSYPARIWSTFMRQAVPLSSPAVASEDELPAPSDDHQIVVRLCTETSALPTERCKDTIEISLPAASVPKKVCSKH